jgi:hypothetical protein
MSLLPLSAGFEELVQDCFLTYRGSGVALSPLDAELVRGWGERGIPFEVVARGIRRSAEKALWDARPGEPLLRSLRGCRRQVEAEIGKHLRASIGRAGGAPASTARAALRAALRRLAATEPALRPRVENLLGDLETGSSLDADRAIACLVRGLPFVARLALLREAEAAVALDAMASPRSLQMARRLARNALARKALALPNFW